VQAPRHLSRLGPVSALMLALCVPGPANTDTADSDPSKPSGHPSATPGAHPEHASDDRQEAAADNGHDQGDHADHDHQDRQPTASEPSGQHEPPAEQPRTDAPPDDGFWHRLQDWLIELLGGEHPHGDGHDGDAPALLATTRYDDTLELFLKRSSLVVDEPAALIVHLTRLADFSPVADGEVLVSLTDAAEGPRTGSASDAGPPRAAARAGYPARPGIYRLQLTPSTAGRQQLRVLWTSGETTAAFVLDVDVAGAAESAGQTAGRHAGHAKEDHPGAHGHAQHEHGAHDERDENQGPPADTVQLTKPQQWRSDFATTVVERRKLRGSVPATASLRPSADGESHVTTPIDGHLRPAAGGFPYTGMIVEPGQILAYLVPRLGGEADVAGLELAVTRAETVLDLARRERERLDALWEDRSIPLREVLQARGDEAVASAELDTARRRLAQVQRTEEGEGAGVPIRAPIGGVVARVEVAPGAFVAEGERLFHLVDPNHLWLDARIAEADLGRIRAPAGAWFQVPGEDGNGGPIFELTPESGARLVAFGTMVDPQSRTVPVIFAFPRPAGTAGARLRVGQSVTARIYTGEEAETLTVPAGALVNDAGAEVVYVQTGGESFERRLVQTGLRDGDLVGVHGGVEAGDRVVSRGAYLVHLAAGATAEPGRHAHAH
jgi:cobalt-zinc-cadmium efflux system membrane fusion protein